MGEFVQRLWAAARGREVDADLRADVARLQGVLDSTMDAVVSVDGRGKIVLFNPGAEQMFGYSASEVLGRSVGLLLPERLRDSHGEHVTRFAAAGTSRRMASSRGEVVGRRADGTEFPAGASICRATVGDDVQMTAIVRDLTSIRAAERESARLAAVLENHSDYVLLAHADSTVTWANASFRSLFDDTFDDTVAGSPFADYCSAECAPLVERAWAEMLSMGAWRGELLLRFGDAYDLPVTVSLHGHVDESTGSVELVSVIAHDVSVLKAAQDALAHAATHDPLTDLPNRALIEQHLEALRRDPTTAAVLFVDLDRFKAVNDTWGHSAGDALLVAVARRLERCVRVGDVVARFGGDEFVVLCSAVQGRSEALALAERITTELEEPFEIDRGTDGVVRAEIGASVGVALSLSDGDHTELLRRADAMLYAAKRAGRGRWMESNLS